MNGTSADLIRYRLERAWEANDDAEVMANLNRWNTCVSRLYYACFYAVSALLLQQNLSSSKHIGIRSFFNRLYVKTGKITPAMDELYNDLFERRLESDYEDFVKFTEADIRPYLPLTQQFIVAIEKLANEESKPA